MSDKKKNIFEIFIKGKLILITRGFAQFVSIRFLLYIETTNSNSSKTNSSFFFSYFRFSYLIILSSLFPCPNNSRRTTMFSHFLYFVHLYCGMFQNVFVCLIIIFLSFCLNSSFLAPRSLTCL